MRRKHEILAIICFAAINITVFGGIASAETPKATVAGTVEPQESFYERIAKLLHPPAAAKTTPPVIQQISGTPIFGPPEVPKEQMIKYILRNNPQPRLTCSLPDLVSAYYEEAALEGVRPDLAVTQAILETGFFRFGGDVLPEQNNFAGLGSTGNARGIWFPTAREGVVAHIQHLLAYSTRRSPARAIVDPRYYIARELRGAQCSTWESLSGTWAVPGINYGQHILRILEQAKQI